MGAGIIFPTSRGKNAKPSDTRLPPEEATWSNNERIGSEQREIAGRIRDFVNTDADECDEAMVQAAESDAKALRRTLETHPYSLYEKACVNNYASAAEDHALIWRTKVGKERRRIESERNRAMKTFLQALDRLADAMDVLNAAEQPELPADMLRRRPLPDLSAMNDVALGEEWERVRSDADGLRRSLAQYERYAGAVSCVKGRAARTATPTLDAIITEYRAKLDGATAELSAIDAERARRAEQAERDRAAAEVMSNPGAAILALQERLDAMDDTDTELQSQLDALRESVGATGE